MPGVPSARTASQAIGALGGALLLTAAAAPWAERGAGSTIALHRVGDLILSGAVDAWAPPWAGLAVYTVPLAGALLLVGAGLGGRVGPAVSGGAVVLAVAGTILVVGALDQVGRAGVGPGPVLAGAGALLGTAAVGLGMAAPRAGPAETGTAASSRE